MSTTDTYDYAPSLGELTLYAFNLCQIRSMELQQQHMQSARTAANLLQGRWAAKGVNLWAVDLQTVDLVAGQAQYDVPSNTIAILDAYVTVSASPSVSNRIILPFSRSEYASLSNPNSEGSPTTYWFDRLLSPTLNLWPVPDGSEVSLSYYRVRQLQDASLTNGAQPEVPIYFLEPYALALAHRLALIWKPERAADLKVEATEAWNDAAGENIENVPLYIAPAIGGYYR